jgi:hypothetical protein
MRRDGARGDGLGGVAMTGTAVAFAAFVRGGTATGAEVIREQGPQRDAD